MLTLKQILKVGNMLEQTGEGSYCPVDRHDNIDHKDYETSRFYENKPGERVVHVNLSYREHPNGDVTIIHR